MVRGGSVRALGVSLASLALLAFASVSPVSASSACSVTVSPHSGVAGTLFSFHGKGFEPTGMTLQKNDGEPAAHELTETNDPWTLAVRSRPGDEGQWTAQFSSAACTAAAEFTVTLTNTDVDPADLAIAASSSTSAPGLPLGLVGVVLVVGAGGGVALGRGLLALSADNRRL